MLLHELQIRRLNRLQECVVRKSDVAHLLYRCAAVSAALGRGVSPTEVDGETRSGQASKIPRYMD